MSFGFGFGFPKNYVAATLVPFTPAMLFTGTTTGAWYDPSDYSTLFQNAAGTTPVTAVEQPVGLMLDKSKGLVLGPSEITGFTPAVTGSATAATYNATTGAGAATRVDGSNLSYLRKAGLASNKVYQITVTNTGSANVQIRQNTIGVGLFNVPSGQTVSGLVTTYTYTDVSIVPTVNGSSVTFTVVSLQEVTGNHAFNGSGNSANFPVLSARYNLLTKTEDFSDAAWTKAGGTSYANSTTAPDGTQTGTLFIENTSNSTHGYWQATSSIPAAVNAKYTINLKYHSRRYVRVAWVTGGGSESVYVDVDLIAGTIVNQGPYGVSVTQTSTSITSAGSGWYTVEVKGTLPSATTYATVYARNSSSNSNPESAFAYTGDGTSGFYVWHPDLRVANDALGQPAYQRVNTSTDYDTVGFKPYLRFNGTNQWLQTNSIDFSLTDKMFVSAGVRKLSDAAYGAIVEMGNPGTSQGSFWINTPNAPSYEFALQGTSLAGLKATTYTAPITSVLSVAYDILASGVAAENKPKINGLIPTLTVDGGRIDAGTGSFGNYPLYLGARAGSSLWFNGRLYGMVVAGKQASAAEITSTETYLNQKTGAF